jgi:hypothetical protein
MSVGADFSEKHKTITENKIQISTKRSILSEADKYLVIIGNKPDKNRNSEFSEKILFLQHFAANRNFL